MSGLYWARPGPEYQLPVAGLRDPQPEPAEVAEVAAMSRRYCLFNICQEGSMAAWDTFRIRIFSEAPRTERSTCEEMTGSDTGLQPRTSSVRR